MNKRINYWLAVMLIFLSACSGGNSSQPESLDGDRPDNVGANERTAPILTTEEVALCANQLTTVADQFEGFRETYTNPTQIPRSFDGRTRIVGPEEWTSGFVAGIYWRLFEHTGSQDWMTAAELWTSALEGQSLRTFDHDVGFIINNTYGTGYRLTNNPDYVEVLISAANSLSSRYNETVGATRSWDFGSWTFPVIIDNMMNLELLYDVAQIAGETRYSDIANRHASTTATNHFRPDSSSFHVLDYNPEDGTLISRGTHQGIGDESAWARGQAWGLYGFTMAYRETGNEAYLSRAQAIANFFTQSSHIPPDAIPYFDFDAPTLDEVPNFRDASAAAISTSALLELAGYVDDASAARYLDFATRALATLNSSEYRAASDTNGEFLLKHTVGNFPANDEIDVSAIYADYYFVESLLRCSQGGHVQGGVVQ